MLLEGEYHMTTVAHLPFQTFISEKQSQKDRVLLEVMEKLFSMMPERGTPTDGQPDFTLKDGTQCWVRGFVSPGAVGDNPNPRYGFDVKLKGGKLDHLEFMVNCTGWGGSAV
jgi:hypothetical protein